jgi:catechol 2,3-dioxygenase-like lactoylglutathione lyase family enzyme
VLTPSGIHHVTAIASDPQRNIDFYVGVLGLHLVKRTVNFDNPTTYHLYFGDDVGHPGTLLTFFPWPNARQGRQGAGQAAVTALSIPPSALGFWLERLLKHHVHFEPPVTRFDDERVIALKDPNGLMLELVAHPSIEQQADDGWGWSHGPVPPEHAIRGVYSVTLWEEGLTRTAELLTNRLGFELVREQGSIYRYAVRSPAPSQPDATPSSISNSGASTSGANVPDPGAAQSGSSSSAPHRPGTLLDLRVVPGLWRGVTGAGTVHHIAFQSANDDIQTAIRAELAGDGYNITPQLDRSYFRSVYFREPGGVLFEIATNTPGFTVDESADDLGRALQLPVWLEPRRFEIEALLPNIHLPIGLPGPNA